MSSSTRTLRLYFRDALIGVALGYLAVLGLARHYVPGRVFAATFPARFSWDSTHGVKAFRLEDSALGDQVGGVAWQYLVGVQIKPELDSYLRRGKFKKATGFALVTVARVIPLALPGSWGSDGMGLDTDVTPLMRAAKAADLDSVKRLLVGGVDVNARDWMGRTALNDACAGRRMDPRVVAALLAAGANPNIPDRGGLTPLMGAVAQSVDSQPGDKDRMSALKQLVAAGADVNAKAIGGGTSLMQAAGEGDAEVVRFLLEAGADVTSKAFDGSTALSLARRHNHAAVVRILKEVAAHE